MKKSEEVNNNNNDDDDKYFDLARELKNLWNQKVMVIPIVIGALGTISKCLVKGLEDLESEDKWRPSKLQHCWDQSEYLEESWRLEVTWCHSDSRGTTSAYAAVKNSKMSKVKETNTKEIHVLVGKVIHLDLCKTLNFGHTKKCYQQKLESVLKMRRINSLRN